MRASCAYNGFGVQRLEPSMNVNQKSYAYGAAKSAIREIAGYGAARRAQIGAENVFDFSIGNPSVPAPDSVRDSIAHALKLPATQLHSYTPGKWPALRSRGRGRLAQSVASRCGRACAADDLYLTCGAAASLTISLNALLDRARATRSSSSPPTSPSIACSPRTLWCHLRRGHGRHGDLPDRRRGRGRPHHPAHQAAVMINSPNNPVGSVYARENLEAWPTC